MSIAHITKRAFAVLAAAQAVSAHSWVEILRQIDSTGAIVGADGFSRAYAPQSSAGFTDSVMENQIIARDASTPMCKSSQTPGAYTSQFPKLTAAAGSSAAMMYQENGHVTNPMLQPTRPFRSGNVFVYGTTQASASDKFLSIHNVWNAEGTGGDGRGKLLASHFFDDGDCFQNRAADPTTISQTRVAASGLQSLYCQTDVQIPSDLQNGDTLTLYWVWDWPLNANEANVANETYTSCADVTIGGSSNNTVAAAVATFSPPANLPTTAVSSQLATPIEFLQLGTGTAAPPAVTDVAVATSSAKGSGGKASSSSKKAQGGFTTVTVTGDVVTVTNYKTVTVGDAGATAASAATSTARSAASASSQASAKGATTKTAAAAGGPATVTSVKPFLAARATGQARRSL
jgi:hypothetical protein